MKELITTVGIFFILQLINVILNTAKALIMARTDNPHLSATINAVTFGFYTMVVKQIAELDLSITIVVVVVTNVIGVYLTYWITNKVKKDSLWKIEIVSKRAIPDIAEEFTNNKIAFVTINEKVLTAYSYTREESTVIRKILSDKKMKYNVTEITRRL